MAQRTKAQRSASAKKAARTRKRNAAAKKSKRRAAAKKGSRRKAAKRKPAKKRSKSRKRKRQNLLFFFKKLGVKCQFYRQNGTNLETGYTREAFASFPQVSEEDTP